MSNESLYKIVLFKYKIDIPKLIITINNTKNGNIIISESFIPSFNSLKKSKNKGSAIIIENIETKK